MGGGWCEVIFSSLVTQYNLLARTTARGVGFKRAPLLSNHFSQRLPSKMTLVKILASTMKGPSLAHCTIHSHLKVLSFAHLAVMARVSCSGNTVPIPVVGVSLDLCIHSIIVVLLILLHLRRMIAGVETCGVACDDADLLTVLIGTSRAMLLRIFQPVGSKQRGSVTLALGQMCL